MAEPTVTTGAGTLQGAKERDVLVFKGVPYGGPTSGDARFRPPRPVERWTGVRPATAHGPACPQPAMVASPESAQLDLGFLEQLCGGGIVSSPEGYDEDCLRLSIWTPACDDRRRPVLVWLHGGWFTFGSTNSRVTDGARLAAAGDVVVVGVNHRLGALGYLWLRDVPGGDFAGTGNVGMLDVIAALEWIREEIAGFGGDPGNVTVFGESGGGAKISMLLGMPAARGLVHRAIVQSGPMLRAVEPHDAAEAATALLDALSARTVEELQGVPVTDLLLAQEQVLGGPLGGAFQGRRFAPVVDGAVLPRHPFEPDAAPSTTVVPLIIGTTRDEMDLVSAMIPGWGAIPPDMQLQIVTAFCGQDVDDLLLAYEASRPAETPLQRLLAIATDQLRVGSIELAERMVAGGADVYMYRLDYDTGALGGQLRAFHGADLPFVFDNLEVPGVFEVGPDAREVSAQMSRAWLAFARSGSPQHDLLPPWPTYDLERRSTMLFDVPPRVAHDPDAKERLAWTGRPSGM